MPNTCKNSTEKPWRELHCNEAASFADQRSDIVMILALCDHTAVWDISTSVFFCCCCFFMAKNSWEMDCLCEFLSELVWEEKFLTQSAVYHYSVLDHFNRYRSRRALTSLKKCSIRYVLAQTSTHCKLYLIKLK